MHALLKQLKTENQDYEFYPTTWEIVLKLYEDLFNKINKTGDRSVSILDIGAGNGGFFKKLDSIQANKIKISERYAIEKSKILTDSMPENIFVIGSDFHSQVLIDKQVDVIFCNPPYSEYVEWAEKIISQANCKYVYLVIPDRWNESRGLMQCIKKREGEYEIIGSFDFLDAERKARAKVDLICVSTGSHERYKSMNNQKVDPFELWFDEMFAINAQQSNYDFRDTSATSKDKFQMIKKENLIFELELLYNNDMQKLLNIYKQLEHIDYDLLQEMEVSIRGLKEGLKLKIKGLKNTYWKELFDNLESITDRLTSASREKMMNKLMSHTSIDFTADNVYQVLMWTIKNANKYFDDQLLEVYEELTEPENVKMYKSNQHFVGSKWRYEFIRNVSRYSLDYRFIKPHFYALQKDIYGSYDYPQGLHKHAHDTINDVFTIAKNLGFSVTEKSTDKKWSSGVQNDFYHLKSEGDTELFASIRAYKNGNLHFKLNQEFMKKFNIEAGRLNGWIKSPEEAVSEMADVTIKDAIRFYGKNLQIGKSDIKMIV